VETLDASSPVPPDKTGETGETAVAALFQARYLEMVRLAVLLGADDAEDIAQEAFARLLTRHVTLRDPGAALAYVRSTVRNLTRKWWRHSLVVRSRTLAMPDEASPEHTAILREDHREVLAALASLEQGHGKPGQSIGGSRMSGIHDGDLDARVRAALRSRAEQVSLGPGAEDAAWTQAVARNRRPGGRVPGGNPGRKAKRWTAPLAAAASVAVIGAGIGIAASLHPAGPAAGAAQPYSATVVSGAAGLTGPDPAMLRSSRPISQVVLVKQVFGTSTSWTYVWFADVSWLSNKGKSLVACTNTYISQPGGIPRQVFRGCDPEALGTGMLSPFGDMVGESSAFDQFGLALRQVTSVTMQSDTDENEKIPASLIDGRGFPYKVFVVGFPAETNVVKWKLVASEDDGRQAGVPFPVASF